MNFRPQVPFFFPILKKFYDVYAHKYKMHLVLLFIGAIVSGILEIIGIIGLYFMIRLLIKIDSMEASHPVIKILDYFELETLSEKIGFFGLFIAIIFIGKNIYLMGYYYYQHYLLRKWKAEISSDFMRKYLNAPYNFLLTYNSATILRNINAIVGTALNGFLLSAFNFMANLITGTIILTLIYLRYFKISLMIAGILGTSTVLQNFFLKKKAIDIGKERDRLLEESNKNVYQGIHAMKETKVMGKEDFFMKAFNELNFNTVANDSKNLLLSRMPKHITEITIIISIVLICYAVLTDKTMTQDSSVASLGALAAIAFRIAPIMNRMLGHLQSMNKNLGSVETMFKEMQKLDAISEKIPKVEQVEVQFEDAIKFDNVSFTYPRTDVFAVQDINMEIKKGQFVGIVGESGAGKSTIMDMLLGLLTPKIGHVLVDQYTLQAKTRKSWQEKIAFVPQNIYLSDDSLIKNVAFGINENDIDREKVMEVLEQVKLMELVREKNNGLDFVIGENGKKLSGGQKQRLAIARALYNDAEVILLDEATSALDLKTEFEISRFLQEDIKGKTIVAIAHRLSTVYDADKIIFMDKGKIVDQGTFDELQMRNSDFEDLAKLARISK